jgi:hypothetical protein
MRYVTGRGGNWATMSLMLGEATNHLQVPWLASKLLGYKTIYNALSLPMTVSFTIFRAFILPVFFGLYVYDTHFNVDRAALPYSPFIEMYFTLCFSAMVAGSLVWLQRLISGYRKMLRKQKTAAASAKKDVHTPDSSKRESKKQQ